MANMKIHYSKVSHALGLFVLVLLMQRAGATEFRIGSSNGWIVPSDPKALSFNQWAEINRFQIGDTLLFVYQPDEDSVLQVNKDDYTNCNTATPIATFNDGNTSFKFNQSGPYYFISGNEENCQKNEKMVVVVMGDRSKTKQTSSASPPSPLPTSTEITPSVAPSGEEYPSPPSPLPNENGAPSKVVVVVVAVMGSIGGFLIGFASI